MRIKYGVAIGLSLFLLGCQKSGEQTAGTNADAKAATGARPDSGATLQPHQVVAIGRIEPEARIVTLGTDVSGIIRRIAADAGDTLRNGQVILELDRSQEAAQLALNQAKLQTQIRNIATSEAALKSAEITAQSNQVKLERTRNVVQRGADTQQALDDAQTLYQTSLEAVQQQRASLAALRSQVQEARDQIRLNQIQVGKRTVNAPSDGVLLTLDVRAGATLSPGTGIGDFAPKSPTTALCEVDELFANDVRVGQPARIRQQGSDRELARGTVIYAAPSLKKKSLFSDDAGNLEDRRVREVRIRITSGQPLLYNSRVECVIDTK